MITWLKMHGYGLYIWTSFGAVMVILIAGWLQVKYQAKKIHKNLVSMHNRQANPQLLGPAGRRLSDLIIGIKRS